MYLWGWGEEVWLELGNICDFRHSWWRDLGTYFPQIRARLLNILTTWVRIY